MVGRGNNNRGMVGRGSGRVSISTNRFSRVLGGTFIGDLSNKSIVVVSSVCGGLDPAIRKSNCEGTGNFALSILGLGLLEVDLGVVISYTIFISKRLRSQLHYRSRGIS